MEKQHFFSFISRGPPVNTRFADIKNISLVNIVGDISNANSQETKESLKNFKGKTLFYEEINHESKLSKYFILQKECS